MVKPDSVAIAAYGARKPVSDPYTTGSTPHYSSGQLGAGINPVTPPGSH